VSELRSKCHGAKVEPCECGVTYPKYGIQITKKYYRCSECGNPTEVKEKDKDCHDRR